MNDIAVQRNGTINPADQKALPSEVILNKKVTAAQKRLDGLHATQAKLHLQQGLLNASRLVGGNSSPDSSASPSDGATLPATDLEGGNLDIHSERPSADAPQPPACMPPGKSYWLVLVDYYERCCSGSDNELYFSDS